LDIQLAREASLTPSLVLKCSLNEKAEGAFTHAFCNAHRLRELPALASKTISCRARICPNYYYTPTNK